MCYVRSKRTSKIDRRGKWKVEKTETLNMKNWPVTYCPGYFVIYTGDIIPELYRAVHRTPFLWLDDVYVMGF